MARQSPRPELLSYGGTQGSIIEPRSPDYPASGAFSRPKVGVPFPIERYLGGLSAARGARPQNLRDLLAEPQPAHDGAEQQYRIGKRPPAIRIVANQGGQEEQRREDGQKPANMQLIERRIMPTICVVNHVFASRGQAERAAPG